VKKENTFSYEDWMNLIKKNKLPQTEMDRDKLVKSLTLGVIPSNMRGHIWSYLSTYNKLSPIQYDKDFYNKLLAEKNDDVEKVINKDIERTLLQLEDKNYAINIVKEKKKELFNVLKAYSVYDRQVGYCQGMNFIVLILLINVNSEIKAFNLLVQLMKERNWRLYFINDTPQLMYTLNNLVLNIKTKLSDLYDHFEKENVCILF
jgi:hypothetical protein